MTVSPEIRPGDIWRDLDPRGGPIFKIVEGPSAAMPNGVLVENLNGKRRRRVLLKRFRNVMWSDTDYRYGYGLYVRREEVVS
jgi:hypothetical protein